MKTLSTVHFVGSQQSRRTGWMRAPGYARADFTDGTSLHFAENKNLPAILSECKAAGVDTAQFEAAMDARRMADYAASHPGEKEMAAELYQHNYGYEKPVALGHWSWSTTFGRWSRLVTFADGWHGYTYPKYS